MTQKTLGPDFTVALNAAGLGGLPFSWSPDGTLTFAPSMTPAQIAAVNAVYAAYSPQYTPAQLALIAYADNKLMAIGNGGITVNVGTSQAPVNVKADTSSDGKVNLSGILQAYALGQITGSYTWFQSSGSLSLTEAQLQAVSIAVMSFVASVYAAWQAVINAIAAGTITTNAQIDTPPSPVPAWPVNS